MGTKLKQIVKTKLKSRQWHLVVGMAMRDLKKLKKIKNFKKTRGWHVACR